MNVLARQEFVRVSGTEPKSSHKNRGSHEQCTRRKRRRNQSWEKLF